MKYTITITYPMDMKYESNSIEGLKKKIKRKENSKTFKGDKGVWVAFINTEDANIRQELFDNIVDGNYEY